MEITFQLVRGLTATSRVIGYFGAGFYSHIDVITPKGMLRGARSDVIMGIPAGCQDRPQDYEKWATQTRYTLDLTPDQWGKYWEFSDRQIGKPYDKRGLVSAFVFGRDWRDDSMWWCSEWTAMNVEYTGFWTIPPEITSVEPGDMAFLLTGAGARREEISVRV
jgi:hypothetical protein